VALTGHRDGLRVAGSSDALRPLASQGGQQKEGSDSLGARSGNVATRHPQAGPGHDPEPLENPTLKGYDKGTLLVWQKRNEVIQLQGQDGASNYLLALAPGVRQHNTRGNFNSRLENQ